MSSSSNAPSCPSLSSLPAELQLYISSHLPYPDALSLKHTCRHFYIIVDTGVRLKVSWLIERRQLHLPCPSEGQCLLKSDEAFCSKPVRKLMERRRRHEECGMAGARGCAVGGMECKRKARGRWSANWGGFWALIIGIVIWWLRGVARTR